MSKALEIIKTTSSAESLQLVQWDPPAITNFLAAQVPVSLR